MTYRIRFPKTGVIAEAVVMDLAVHFTRGIDSIRLRSTETAVRGITRAYPGVEVYDGTRRVA
jgi:hypothetical protein